MTELSHKQNGFSIPWSESCSCRSQEIVGAGVIILSLAEEVTAGPVPRSHAPVVFIVSSRFNIPALACSAGGPLMTGSGSTELLSPRTQSVV